MNAAEHAELVGEWRARRDERLRDPSGWLTLVGLHWLTDGEHELGQHPSNAIRLHGTDVPPLAGHLQVRDGRGWIRPHHAAELLVNGKRLTAIRELADDASGTPTILELGSLRMHLIRRGERLALRVRDRDAPALAEFAGVPAYPPDLGWRVSGRLERAAADETVEIVDITGAVARDATPGTFLFERDGTTHRLVTLPADDDDGGERLWLIFADATTGEATYGGGRYLISEPVEDGDRVVADFNLAYNPPCVFSAYATCPLPPESNRLPILVEAGELEYRPGTTAEGPHAAAGGA